MEDFLWRALAGGCGVAMLAGPLGVFVVWRRMAYFGDTLAHAALLGVALGVLTGLAPTSGVLVLCTVLALVLTLLQRQQQVASDTLLGIVSHATLSLGMVALAFLESVRVDLISYLFGDILAITTTDLLVIYGGGLVVLLALLWLWRPLLAITVDADLARVEGVAVQRVELAFMLLLALVVAMAMKLVGLLLITALLVIPAATARRFARTPEQMALYAAMAGGLAVILGLGSSMAWDIPSGPAVVVAAAGLFVVSLPGHRS